MRPSEALETLKILQRWFLKYSDYYKAITVAISALEKQEPMKPLQQEMDIDGRAITPCGFCGEELPRNILYNFCPYCGQAIDRRKE